MNRPSLSSFAAKSALVVSALTTACSSSPEARNTQVADAIINETSGILLKSSDISGNDSKDAPKGDISPDVSAPKVYMPVDETPTCETYDEGDKNPCNFDINQSHTQTINQALAHFQLVDQALDTTFSGVVPSVDVKTTITENSDPKSYDIKKLISTDKKVVFEMGKDSITFTAQKGVFNYSDPTDTWTQFEYMIIYQQGDIVRNIRFLITKNSNIDILLGVGTLNLACNNKIWRSVALWKEPWEYNGKPFVQVGSGRLYPTSNALYPKHSECNQGEKKEDICADTGAKIYATCPFLSDELNNIYGPFINHSQDSFDLSVMSPVWDTFQQYKDFMKKHGIDIDL